MLSAWSPPPASGRHYFSEIPDSHHLSLTAGWLCDWSWAWARATQPWRAAAGTAMALPSDCAAATHSCFLSAPWFPRSELFHPPESHPAQKSCSAGELCRLFSRCRGRHGVSWQPAAKLLFPLQCSAPQGLGKTCWGETKFFGKIQTVKEQVTAPPCHWLISVHAGAPAQCPGTPKSP